MDSAIRASSMSRFAGPVLAFALIASALFPAAAQAEVHPYYGGSASTERAPETEFYGDPSQTALTPTVEREPLQPVTPVAEEPVAAAPLADESAATAPAPDEPVTEVLAETGPDAVVAGQVTPPVTGVAAAGSELPFTGPQTNLAVVAVAGLLLMVSGGWLRQRQRSIA